MGGDSARHSGAVTETLSLPAYRHTALARDDPVRSWPSGKRPRVAARIGDQAQQCRPPLGQRRGSAADWIPDYRRGGAPLGHRLNPFAWTGEHLAKRVPQRANGPAKHGPGNRDATARWKARGASLHPWSASSDQVGPEPGAHLALSRPLRTLAGGVKRRSAIAVDTASSNSELLLNSETCVRTQPRVEERTSHARSERGLLSRRASRCNSEGRSGSRTVCSRQPANQGRIRY